MNCEVWEALFNDRLDGGPAAPLEDHLRDCPVCAARRADLLRLQRGLDLLTPPPLPPGLTARIVSAVMEDRGRRPERVRRWMPYAALAASVLLVIVGLRLGQSTHRPTPAPVIATGPALRDSVSRAGQAVASLTARTATATVEETARLIPPMEGLPIEPPAAPPLEPIREATEEAATRLAPVTDSARRAVNLFFRDLPMPRTTNNPG